MNQKKSVIKISDEQINEGLTQGRFIESGTQIRDVNNGQIIKVIKASTGGASIIPSTFIQFHHNYLYQADLSPILDAIAHERESTIYNELEEQYNLAMDYIDSYNTYNTGVEKAHQICLEISVSFDNKIRREIENIDVNRLDELDTTRFIGSINAYVKILLSYVMSTYILHRDKFSKDKVIISKIVNLESSTRALYEQILAKSRSEQYEHGNVTKIFMRNSLYSMYLFNDDFDIDELDRLVVHDSRFSSSLGVIGYFKDNFKSGFFSDEWEYRNNDIKISISNPKILRNSKRAIIAMQLVKILEDIEKIKAIREEIVNLKDISDAEVINYTNFQSNDTSLSPHD